METGWRQCFSVNPSLIGCFVPQALIYPLTVASKSTTTARHNAANKILKNMCEHCNALVQQAIMVRTHTYDMRTHTHKYDMHAHTRTHTHTQEHTDTLRSTYTLRHTHTSPS